ncbi:hypothetical protein [Priestia megaterium]
MSSEKKQIEAPVTELPNPIRLLVLTKPPAIVVKTAGSPEAYGMIASVPVALVE